LLCCRRYDYASPGVSTLPSPERLRPTRCVSSATYCQRRRAAKPCRVMETGLQLLHAPRSAQQRGRRRSPWPDAHTRLPHATTDTQLRRERHAQHRTDTNRTCGPRLAPLQQVGMEVCRGRRSCARVQRGPQTRGLLSGCCRGPSPSPAAGTRHTRAVVYICIFLQSLLCLLGRGRAATPPDL